VLGAAFSGDGQRLVTVGEDAAARVWKVDNGEPAAPPLRQLLQAAVGSAR